MRNKKSSNVETRSETEGFKRLLAKTRKFMNGDDNVIPMGPIPHEKPWYETDEGKKLIAKTSKSELIEMLGGLTGRGAKAFKGMSESDLIEELDRYIDFKMALKKGGLVSSYKQYLRKP